MPFSDIASTFLRDTELGEIQLQSELSTYKSRLDDNLLYPSLSELERLKSNFDFVVEGYETMIGSFGRPGHTEISADFLHSLFDEGAVDDQELKDNVKRIYDFSKSALREMSPLLRDAKDLLSTVEESLVFKWIDYKSRACRSGFLLISQPSDKDSGRKLVFHYKRNQNLRTHSYILELERRGVVSDPRLQVAWQSFLGNRSFSGFFNPDPPAAFAEVIPYPLEETVLPVVKRSFLEFIQSGKKESYSEALIYQLH